MTRQCGTCTLCCKLVPVADLGKPANHRCEFQRMTGCKIYPRRPHSCRLWNCRWLVDDDTADLSRPDRSHYVIDVMPDYVVLRDDATGQGFEMPVVQVWCDPAHAEAHRDPALRRYLERQRMAALVRFGNELSILIAPPSVCGRDGWYESQPAPPAHSQHSAKDVARVVEEWGKP